MECGQDSDGLPILTKLGVCGEIMVNFALMNDQTKWAIVLDFKATGSISQASRSLGVSRNTVTRWVNRHKSTRVVSSLKTSGRRPTISGSAAERALELLIDGRQSTADQVASLLRSEGFTNHALHKSTVISWRDEWQNAEVPDSAPF